MSDRPQEFWRGMKPVATVFRKDARPEVHIARAAEADERYFVHLSETVLSRPLWISPSRGQWCDVLYARQAGLVNRHYHAHQVFAYTLSGRWGYLEHDWVAEPGDFTYESPGESHTLIAYDSAQPMKAMFNVTGPLIWLDEDGKPNGTFDAFDYLELCRQHYEEVGLGAALIDKLVR